MPKLSNFFVHKRSVICAIQQEQSPKKVAIIDDGINSSKAQSFKEALQNNNMEHTTSPCPTDNCSIEVHHTLEPKWATSKTAPKYTPNETCKAKLTEYYDIGKNDKSKKISAQIAHQKLTQDEDIKRQWDQVLLLSYSILKTIFAQIENKKRPSKRNNDNQPKSRTTGAEEDGIMNTKSPASI